MSITYTIDVRDLRAFQKYASRNLPNLKRIRYLFILVLVGFSIYMAFSPKDEELRLGPGTHYGVRIVYALFFFVVTYAIWRGAEFLVRRLVEWRAYTAEKYKTMLCEHTVTLADDGFVESTAFNKQSNDWRGIYRVVDARDYIYVFTSVYSAHVIPKRAFANVDDLQRFLNRATSLHAAAQKSN